MSDTLAPERKRLKSTYKPPPPLAPLPPGWTEHTAPTGHKYYYHAQTKQSTYTRPAALPPPAASTPPPPAPYAPPPQTYSSAAPPSQIPAGFTDYAALAQSYTNGHNPYPAPSAYTVPPLHFNQQHDLNRQPFHHQRRPQPEDRPKKKAIIPECAPWILVYTKLGRRFVHNTETQESLWKFPPDVMNAVIEFDKLELEKKLAAKDEGTGANNVPVRDNPRNNRRRRSESLQREDEAAMAALAAQDDQEEADSKPTPARDSASRTPGPTAAGQPQDDAEDSSEYEEIEVTDDEDEQDQAADTRDGPPAEDGPVEFGEDDIAYQLAQMGADYGLDPGEYDDGTNDAAHLEEGAEGLPLSDEDAAALFKDMLDDLHIHPFTPWDKLIEDGHIIDDERYTILPSTKLRREVWDQWSRERIAALKAAREKMEKQDPKIPYLALLSEKATPKLYWAEFKRKFKKEAAMRDVGRFGDKEREKLYREYIARLKLPERQLKSEFAALLKGLPLSVLNNATAATSPPQQLLSDIRFVSLPQKTREQLLEAHISTLPPPPDGAAAENEEEAAERERKIQEREKREAALRERERRVQEDKRRSERDIRAGMGRLRENERELEGAMRVGREGLRAQFEGEDGGHEPGGEST